MRGAKGTGEWEIQERGAGTGERESREGKLKRRAPGNTTPPPFLELACIAARRSAMDVRFAAPVEIPVPAAGVVDGCLLVV